MVAILGLPTAAIERVRDMGSLSRIRSMLEGLDERFTNLYQYPLKKIRTANVSLSRLHSNAQTSSSKAYDTAVYLFKNLGQMGPDFAVPTLGDIEKVTSAFISMSTEDGGGGSIGGGGEKGGSHSSHSGAGVNGGMIGTMSPTFQDLKFSNERVSELMRGALRFLAEARTSTPSQVISRMLFYLADTVGTSLDSQHRDGLERQVGHAIHDPNGAASAGLGTSQSIHSMAAAVAAAAASSTEIAERPYQLRQEKQAMTGVVLSYREREDQLPWTKSRKIQRSMHYKMPLRPFQATVFIPNVTTDNVHYDTVPTALRRSCTPQSFPASPSMRNRVLTGFSNYTEDVLYRARDELRCNGQEDFRAKNATFNLGDAHRDVILSCGLHCASRDGQGLHRSVRATLPIQRGVPVYFEMQCVQCVPALEDEMTRSVGMVASQNTSGFSGGDVGSFMSGTASAMTTTTASAGVRGAGRQSVQSNVMYDGDSLSVAHAQAQAQAQAHAQTQAEAHAFEVAQHRSMSSANAAGALTAHLNSDGLPIPEMMSSSNSLQQHHQQQQQQQSQLRPETDISSDHLSSLGHGHSGSVDGGVNNGGRFPLSVSTGATQLTSSFVNSVAPTPAGGFVPHTSALDSPTSVASDLSRDPDVCIGLSTINFPLNFLVGSRRYSIGMASCGHLVAGPVWLRGSKGQIGTDASFCHGNVVGVLVQILEDECDMEDDDEDEPEMMTVLTNFFVDGEPVVGLPDPSLELRIPVDVDVYPTLSICSSSTKVFGHFSTEDILYGTPEQLSPFIGQESVYALDGSLIYHESSLYSKQHRDYVFASANDEEDSYSP